jgi:hypothetical protein
MGDCGTSTKFLDDFNGGPGSIVEFFKDFGSCVFGNRELVWGQEAAVLGIDLTSATKGSLDGSRHFSGIAFSTEACAEEAIDCQSIVESSR